MLVFHHVKTKFLDSTKFLEYNYKAKKIFTLQKRENQCK